MKKQNLLIVAVIVLIGVGAFVYINNTLPTPTGSPQSQTVSQATFTVGDVTYPIDIATGTSVLDAMKSLSSSGAITYTSQEYPGLGAFIDSINGQKSDKDNYWILYVNGTTTASGVSATTIASGDTVEWRYEKGY